MEEPRQNVFFLVHAAQALEKLLLGFAMHHEVGAGDQQLGRYPDRLGIGDHAFAGFVEAQEHIDRNALGDQRVLVIRRYALRVVSEKARLDVAVDEKVAAQLTQQGQPRPGQGHVKFDFERWRREHQCADARGIVVNPGGNDHRAYALGNHGDVFFGDVMGLGQVLAEGLHVAGAGGKAWAVAAGAG
ncbi:hypothetical protein D3C77_324140 [compost metagenome]